MPDDVGRMQKRAYYVECDRAIKEMKGESGEKMESFNVYEDERCAEAYSRIEFPGTYYLAYRDIPQNMSKHVMGNVAMDFGCGAGRSSRFLTRNGFEVVGVDIAEDMIERARAADPNGNYRLIADGDFSRFGDNAFDLVLSMFTFDNIPVVEKKVRILKEIGRILKNGGRMVNLVSRPEIYTHEWASFSTRDFPENRFAKGGEVVKIIITASEDRRPVEDIVFPDKDYREVFQRAGLKVVEKYTPLAREDEPFDWVTETKIAPWAVYVLEKTQKNRLRT